MGEINEYISSNIKWFLIKPKSDGIVKPLMFQKPVKIGHFELLLTTNARGLQDLPFNRTTEKHFPRWQ